MYVCKASVIIVHEASNDYNHYVYTGNILYPLKVCGKPESDDEHTVTLFYAVPISIEGVFTSTTT